MAHNRKTELRNTFGILVHQLPKKYKHEVFSHFSRQSIEEIKHNAEGLRIYFKEYEHAWNCILRRTIEVEGISYKIYPLVTNLTIHRIGRFAMESTIKKHVMQLYAFVIQTYPITEKTKHRGYETVSLTDDYRVILNVPEVFVNFELLPIRLSGAMGSSFKVSFFCRLCRANGHMQYQCPEGKKCASAETSEQQCSIDSHRRISCETDFPDSLMNHDGVNQCTSDHCSNHHSPKTNTRFRIPLKYEKQQSHNTSRNHFVKSEFYHDEDPKICISDSEFKNSKHSQSSHNSNIPNDCHDDENILRIKEEVCYSEATPASTNKHCESFGVRRRSGDKSLLQTSDSESTSGPTETLIAMEHSIGQASTSSGIIRKKAKTKFLRMFSSLFPSDTDPQITRRLYKTVLSLIRTGSDDISEEVEGELQKILYSNRGVRKDLTEKAERFLDWIERFLEKVRNKRRERRGYGRSQSLPQETTIAHQSKSETPQPQLRRQRSLSSATTEAIRLTNGVLPRELLINFLNQVRNRKNLIPIASKFTKDIPALDAQLAEVTKNYFMYGQKSTDGDGDMRIIESLRRRLIEQNMKAKEEVGDAGFMRQSSKEETFMGGTSSRDSFSNQSEEDCSQTYFPLNIKTEPMESD